MCLLDVVVTIIIPMHALTIATAMNVSGYTVEWTGWKLITVSKKGLHYINLLKLHNTNYSTPGLYSQIKPMLKNMLYQTILSQF